MEKIFYFIRKITVPPIFAMAFLLLIYFIQPSTFTSVWQLMCGIFFLGILPILGYPLQKYIPYFKKKGREGQRSLAMIFSVVGYLLGTFIVFVTKASSELCIVYLEYLLSGILMLVFNKGFHLKASGHACGIVGPVLLFIYFDLFIPAMIGAVFVIPVLVSSLKTKRHTMLQLLGGCMISAMCLVIIKCFDIFII
ncbi:MAG: hypothetical protein ACI4DK_01825 [Lachnospiraceae bacterium]